MLKNIVMPKLGDTMEEGTIAAWLVSEGDEVKKGDVVMTAETDKATLEVESFVEGRVLKLVVPEGETVPVGEVVAYVGDNGDQVPEDETNKTETKTPPHHQKPILPQSTQSKQRKTGKILASPRARKLAAQMGIDLSKVPGTGPDGRITGKDVEKYTGQQDNPSPQTELAQVSGEVLPLNRFRKLTAEKMVQSRQTIPCFDLSVDVQTDNMAALMQASKVLGQKVAVHDLLIAGISRAFKEFPVMTGQYSDIGISLPKEPGIGLAIGLEEGLVAPVLRNGEGKTLGEIAQESRTLIDKARSNHLEPADLEGACITISNLGMLDIESFTPIVIPGQGSILGVGKIREIAEFINGQIQPVKRMKLVLSVDHRLTDGAYAAAFLRSIKEYLEDPGAGNNGKQRA